MFVFVFVSTVTYFKPVRSKYSARRLIGLRIIRSADYCSQNIAGPIICKQGTIHVGLNHSAIVITSMSVQSDPINRRTMFLDQCFSIFFTCPTPHWLKNSMAGP